MQLWFFFCFFFNAGLNSFSLLQPMWVFSLNIISCKSLPRKVKCKMINGSYISRKTKEGQADQAFTSVFVFMGASSRRDVGVVPDKLDPDLRAVACWEAAFVVIACS